VDNARSANKCEATRYRDVCNRRRTAKNSNSASRKVAEVRVAMGMERVLDAGEAPALSIVRNLLGLSGLKFRPNTRIGSRFHGRAVPCWLAFASWLAVKYIPCRRSMRLTI
jgi:hypothetical protein